MWRGRGRSVLAAAWLAVSRSLATAGLFDEFQYHADTVSCENTQLPWPEGGPSVITAGHGRSVLTAAIEKETHLVDHRQH